MSPDSFIKLSKELFIENHGKSEAEGIDWNFVHGYFKGIAREQYDTEGTQNMIDIHFSSDDYKTNYKAEVTEDYEGDKFHVVVFESEHLNSDKVLDQLRVQYDHYDTQGFDSIEKVYDYIKSIASKVP